MTWCACCLFYFSCSLISNFNLTPFLLQLLIKLETLYREISDVLESLEKKSSFPGLGNEQHSDSCDIHSHIKELKDMLKKERNDYQVSNQKIIIDLDLSMLY